MDKCDLKLIESLLDKNDYFFKINKIGEDEYLQVNFTLISIMEKFLKDEERKSIINFLEDEFSLPKFRLILASLNASVN